MKRPSREAMPGPRPRPLEQRFWPKVAKTSGCWLWTASVDKDGYGQLGSDGNRASRTMLKAHRVSWELANGPIGGGLAVLHRCDNPPCVNPDHLFLGTNQDNIDDMNRKRRNVFHRRNPSLKLSNGQVDAIRTRRSNGERLSSIAEDFGVTQGTVSRIANGLRRREADC